MAHWLLKSEPDVYSFDDLLKDKKTVWDGVANNTALIHIRAAKKGDTAVIYHTGDERAAVGLAEIVSGPYADPKLDNPKAAVFDIKAGKRFKRPVTLAEIKADPVFAGWDLIRLGRLSVVPVPSKMWSYLLKLSEKNS
jgi:predicted RNA-binding protein with PUA-like domain